jgi:hypothetical protein
MLREWSAVLASLPPSMTTSASVRSLSVSHLWNPGLLCGNKTRLFQSLPLVLVRFLNITPHISPLYP